MTSRTPGSASTRVPSIRPSFPTTPIAVRNEPGIGRPSYPSSSMVRTTRSTSNCDASCFITTSMPVLAESNLDGPTVEGHRHRALKSLGDGARYVDLLDGRIEMRQGERPGSSDRRQRSALRGSQVMQYRHRLGQR